MKHSTKMMVLIRLIYSIFKSFILIFVNIYLWQTGKSIQAVAVFNIFNYFGATVSFVLGNLIAIKDSRYNYILSSLSFIFAFAMTAALGEAVASYALLIGLLGGCGDGFFFFNLNTFQADELDKEEMDQFMSVVAALNKVSSIVTPLVSGLVIERFGFGAMVNLLLVLLVFQLGLSFRMPRRKIDGIGRFALRDFFGRGSYSKVLWTNTAKSPYKQFTTMVNSVFLFSIVASESLIGVLNAGFSVVSILMFVLYRRALKRIKRKRLMLWGATASGLIFLLMIRPGLTTFILYGILVSFGDAFFNIPIVGVQIHSAKKHAASDREVLGHLIHRVIMLNTGRIAFFTLIYFFYTDFTSPIFVVFLIYNLISPFFNYWLAHKEI